MLHVCLEFLRVGVHPRVLDIGDAMKGHYRDFAVAGLGYRLLELLQRALRLTVKGLWHQQCVVLRRIKRTSTACSRELIPSVFQHLDRNVAGRITGVAEADGLRNSVSGTLLLDVSHVRVDLAWRLPSDSAMPSCVVANFKSRLVQSADLLPRHVVFFISREVEAFRDEERRSETELLQEWADVFRRNFNI